MPPKGRRGSLATMALRKTAPHCSSAMRRCCSAGSRVQAEAARPKGVSLAISMASSRSVDAEEHGDGAEEFFAVDGRGAGNAGEDGGLEVVAVADHALAAGEDAGSGARLRHWTWSSSSSTMRAVASGPRSVSSCMGSPTRMDSMPVTKRDSKAS